MDMIGEPHRDDLIDNCNCYASDGVKLFETDEYTVKWTSATELSHLSRLACQLWQLQESENLIETIQHVDL
jgi:hypothetical protein